MRSSHSCSNAGYQASLVAHGFPESAAVMLTGMFAASRAGEFARVDPALAGLIGRPPMSPRDFLRPAISPAG